MADIQKARLALRRAVRRLVKAEIDNANKGAGHPDDFPIIEDELKAARRAHTARLEQFEQAWRSTVYLVFAENIYRHGCIGVFDDKDVAIQAARDTASHEYEDGHHDYVVYEFEMNKVTSHARFGYRHNIEEEGVEVFRANKRDKER